MKYLKIGITLIFLLSCLNIFAQKKRKFAEHLIYNTALSYLNRSDAAFSNIERNEWAWNNNVAVNLTSSLYFGIGFFHIRTRDIIAFNPPQKQNYNMATAFLQYDIYPIIAKQFAVPEGKVRFYPEIHWGFGNYCFCALNTTLEAENAHYFGYGFGMDFYVKKRLAISIGLLAYDPLSEELDSSNRDYYTYKIGLSFDIISQNK
jgi:hypothetical protein